MCEENFEPLQQQINDSYIYKMKKDLPIKPNKNTSKRKNFDESLTSLQCKICQDIVSLATCLYCDVC